MDGYERSPIRKQRQPKLNVASEQTRSLGAKWVYTMVGPPLENHLINITGDKVETVSATPAYSAAEYLGDHCVILPATVNAHTHLELSQLEFPLDVPSRSMSDWVAALLAFRRNAAYNAREGIRQALCRPELLESTIAVADIVPEDCMNGGDFSPLFLHSFVELIAWRNEEVEKLNFDTCAFGLSPHAPHTVCPALLERAVRQNVSLAMHLAETREELQLLRYCTGPLLEMMRRADPDYDPKSVLIGKSPMDYLQLLSTAPNVFIIHGNYLDDAELRFLAAHRETMAVVYCPRSHAYFRHASYPLKKMLDYGVRVLLGTDSLASTPNLSLVEEMQFALQRHPRVSPEIVYRLGTLEGALAFSLPKGVGTIQHGSPARFAPLLSK